VQAVTPAIPPLLLIVGPAWPMLFTSSGLGFEMNNTGSEGDRAGMFKTKMIVSALFAVLAVSAAVTASAPAQWMVNGANLVGNKKLATTAQVDKKGILTFGGLNIECNGTLLEGSSPEIRAPDAGFASSLTFTGCATTNQNCSVPANIGTVPILAKASLDGALAVKAVFRPETGTTFATINLSGQKCAVSGVKPVTGDMETSVPTGQDERTLQLLETNQAATGLLQVASSAASLTGSALLKLESGETWSFL
jgi:hypothetical protein